MSLYEWCHLAKNEASTDFVPNNNYLNWLLSYRQKLLRPGTISKIVPEFIEKYHEYKLIEGRKDSSNLLDMVIYSFKHEVRRSGPLVDVDENTFFISITDSAYPIPSTSGASARKSKPAHRPGDESRHIWITPAENLLTSISDVEAHLRVSKAARLLGLNKAGKNCRMDFYKRKPNGIIYRPNIFSGVDNLRWAGLESREHETFGCTLDSSSGEPSISEAVTTFDQLTPVDPRKIDTWHSYNWFTDLLPLGFTGDVFNDDNPDLESVCSISKEFRLNSIRELNRVLDNSHNDNFRCLNGKCEVPNNY